RGIPTIETYIELDDSAVGIYSVPSGTSKGKHEAKELRDNDANRYAGLGVLTALKNISQVIAPKIIGIEVENQASFDNLLITLDGSADKSHLGANTLLSLSGAVAKATAVSQKIPLYQYVSKLMGQQTNEFAIPTPMFNEINGGAHAGFNLDFQEFMLVPPKSNSYSQNLKFGAEMYYALKKVLQTHTNQVLIGDEGGYAPLLYQNGDVFKIFEEAAQETGYKIGLDAFFSLDCAANNLKQGSAYRLKDRPTAMPASDLIEFYVQLNEQFHMLSIEDPLAEEDWDDWVQLNAAIGAKTLIVGDDLIATNPERLKKAAEIKACNAVIIKPNQIGTISEAIKVTQQARASNMKIIVAHRSGETNDDFIADFAVGVGADYVKFGAPARGERVAKYNRLLEIEHELS
ncbi:phosphopyruvate hydratase, partial [Candidatus Curtissbacteria bacterium]|nr:phosphopyruvate hydratase [Candidatus Curtissbacteria bacterium]